MHETNIHKHGQISPSSCIHFLEHDTEFDINRLNYSRGHGTFDFSFWVVDAQLHNTWYKWIVTKVQPGWTLNFTMYISSAGSKYSATKGSRYTNKVTQQQLQQFKTGNRQTGVPTNLLPIQLQEKIPFPCSTKCLPPTENPANSPANNFLLSCLLFHYFLFNCWVHPLAKANQATTKVGKVWGKKMKPKTKLKNQKNRTKKLVNRTNFQKKSVRLTEQNFFGFRLTKPKLSF